MLSTISTSALDIGCEQKQLLLRLETMRRSFLSSLSHVEHCLVRGGLPCLLISIFTHEFTGRRSL